MGKMAWMSKLGGDGTKILHLHLGDRWVPYHSAPQYAVADHKIANGSAGYATMQSLLKLGWELVPSPMSES